MSTLFTDLGGEIWRIRRFADEKDTRFSAFNPSIAYSPAEGYVVLLRSSNYFFDPKNGDTVATAGNRVINRMWMANLDKNWQIIEETMRELDFSENGKFMRGAEDGRLYWRDGAWEILSVMKEPHLTNDVPRLGTFRLDGVKAKLLNIYDTDDLQPVEKNWMPTYEKNPLFDFVYSATSIYVNDLGKKSLREPSIQAGNNIRGGSCLWDLGDWGYIAIVHEVDPFKQMVYSARSFAYRAKTFRHYYHRFARYDRSGKLIGLSDRFKFTGVRIEFAAGLVISENDVIVSYGHKDVASYLAKISLNKVKDLIHVIDI
jgi:hypothetical protein